MSTRVLVLGARGFIGRALVPRLVDLGLTVRAGFTDPARATEMDWPAGVEAVRCDVLDPASVRSALGRRGEVDAVVYLVHRMTGGADFRAEDAHGAATVRDAMAAAGVGRAVYLSGLAPTLGGRPVPEAELSAHMASRGEVEQILSAGPVPVFTLRAGVVLGRGSTSYEVLRDLCELLPVQPVPTWMNHLVEPVAVADVVDALCGALTGPARTGHADIGCGEQLTYPRLLARYSRAARLPTLRVPVPPVPWELVAAGLTPVCRTDPATVAAMIESLHHDMVAVDAGAAAELFPPGWSPTGIDDALATALGADAPRAVRHHSRRRARTLTS